MRLTFVHTAQVHCATFDGLRDRITPETQLDHIVRADWLARAQGGIDDTLTQEITQSIQAIETPVICTCTTLGEVAEAAGAIRIDRPMMRRAAETWGDILLVFTLKSTEAPSTALLRDELDRAGNPRQIVPLLLDRHWPLFEDGRPHAFARAIASDVRSAVTQRPGLKAIVLAQASMAGAAVLLSDLPIPVLSSPVLALKEGLARL
ncbi:hypothetical protein E7681_01430 [Thalassobius vesicularis]|uniref:Arylsulfatase n=1 Tax=Thalassobius vesicularis TaxID=1294297 RepID=A0A4S3MD55_9RHOB|nr:hypothetical protein [Thalassobius vesicularis]THD76532.1 hypothetical protein E7681_01430 [Thalassobius vesicularis]